MTAVAEQAAALTAAERAALIVTSYGDWHVAPATALPRHTIAADVAEHLAATGMVVLTPTGDRRQVEPTPWGHACLAAVFVAAAVTAAAPTTGVSALRRVHLRRLRAAASEVAAAGPTESQIVDASGAVLATRPTVWLAHVLGVPWRGEHTLGWTDTVFLVLADAADQPAVTR